jgi:hypothetical protein
MSDLDALDAADEEAERRFIEGIRGRARRDVMAERAEAVAVAAATWNSAAYERFHRARGADPEELGLLTERTEVLSELWADIAAAYR